MGEDWEMKGDGMIRTLIAFVAGALFALLARNAVLAKTHGEQAPLWFYAQVVERGAMTDHGYETYKDPFPEAMVRQTERGQRSQTIVFVSRGGGVVELTAGLRE